MQIQPSRLTKHPKVGAFWNWNCSHAENRSVLRDRKKHRHTGLFDSFTSLSLGPSEPSVLFSRPLKGGLSLGRCFALLTVALLGLPGSGKSTLCNGFEVCQGWQCFKLGDAIRARAAEDPVLSEVLGKGELAPESIVIDLIQTLAAQSKENFLVIDGFPRQIDQIEIAKQLFSWVRSMRF